jgi:hypothetical protein
MLSWGQESTGIGPHWQAGYIAGLVATGTGFRINNAGCNLFLNNYSKRFIGFTATISWRAQPFRGSGRLA